MRPMLPPRFAVLPVLMILALALLPTVALHAEGSGPVKVVYHADFADPRRFSAMLTSINNMATYYENELVEYDIRIVFVAHGLRFLTDDPLAGTPFESDQEMEARRESNRGRLAALHEVKGVKLELCEITRSQVGLATDKLYDGTERVPSGVVRLAELQREGFAYIKIE